MPEVLVRKRSASFGSLPDKTLHKIGLSSRKVPKRRITPNRPIKEKVIIDSGDDDDSDDDDDLPPTDIGDQEPTPALENDLPPDYDELEEQVKNLQKGNNLEKWLRTSKVKLPPGVALPTVKDKLREFEKKFAKDEKGARDMPYHEELELKLEDLQDGDNLEKWLETLEHKPKVNVPQVKKMLEDYFKGHHRVIKSRRSPLAQVKPSLRSSKPDNIGGVPIPGPMWAKFKNLSTAKKVAVVVGITVVAAGVGVLTWTLIGAAMPQLLLLTQGPMVTFFAEFSFEMLRIRNEVSFSLLALSIEHAKPLSRPWRDQFLIYAYI